MFTITVDGNTLYAPHLFHEGCGVFSPKLTLEMNKAGSLDFTLPPTNLMYDKINKLKSVVNVLQNGEEIFSGRLLYDEKDFYNQKKVYCEGELAYLLDSIVRPYDYAGTEENPKQILGSELFKKFINDHNSRMANDSEKKFTVGNITVGGSVSCSNNSYPSTYDEITSQLVGVLGGYLSIRKVNGVRYIDWLAYPTKDDPTPTTTQTIEFGSNLLDITEYITAEELCTVVIPVGAVVNNDGGSGEKYTIESVNNGKDYIENATAINLFGRIEKKVEYSDVSKPSTLKKLGTKYLEENIEAAVSMTVRAIDLYYLNVSVDQLRVGDWVQVISIPHGLNKPFQCTKIIYDLESPDQNEYSFGREYTSLTSQQVASKKGSSKLSSIVMPDDETVE